MGIADRLKDLKTKAVDATAEHSDKIHEAVEKVAATADERTGGKYSERIQKAGAKAGSLVDGFTGSEQQGAAGAARAGTGTADASPDAGAPSPDAGTSSPAEASPAAEAEGASSQ
jgi:MT0933-like antitoxin protein